MDTPRCVCIVFSVELIYGYPTMCVCCVLCGVNIWIPHSPCVVFSVELIYGYPTMCVCVCKDSIIMKS